MFSYSNAPIYKVRNGGLVAIFRCPIVYGHVQLCISGPGEEHATVKMNMILTLSATGNAVLLVIDWCAR